ncbi:hypothetical protein T265_09605 [Opisthorchis viverrini]|uniref:Uncharacterized protein n=1 Tax=Opisthorchis viverrini TaxID=6198 RepID=A0A074Z5C3_OPIVI|nr:hypothetical protein T265_09605 [Opisthorchis viverrini]KER22278.1 hypothetical protein T265_09605 [Opisthorchis viverrini]
MAAAWVTDWKSFDVVSAPTAWLNPACCPQVRALCIGVRHPSISEGRGVVERDEVVEEEDDDDEELDEDDVSSSSSRYSCSVCGCCASSSLVLNSRNLLRVDKQ